MVRFFLVLLLGLCSTALHAQQRFSVLPSTMVALEAFPGDTVASSFLVVRHDRTLESVVITMSGFGDQFFSNRLGGSLGQTVSRTVVFGTNGLASDTVFVDVHYIGTNTPGITTGTMVLSAEFSPSVTIAVQGESLPRFSVLPIVGQGMTLLRLEAEPEQPVTGQMYIVRHDPKLPGVNLRLETRLDYDVTKIWSIREVNPRAVTKPLSFGSGPEDPASDTIILEVTFNSPPEEQWNGAFRDVMDVTDNWSTTVRANLHGIPKEASPIIVAVSTTSAEVGETTTVSLTTTTALPDALTTCELDLIYNATVLAPVESSNIISDGTTDGKRTTRYRSTIDRSGTLGAFPFTVLLGNAASTTVEIANLQWKDAQGNVVDRPIHVFNGTVSVLDAEGSLVNANAGPLSMVLSAPRADRSASIVATVKVGGASARLVLFDGSGSVVSDVSNQLSGDGGMVTIPTASLSGGVYTLLLTSGTYSYAARFIVY